MPRRASNDLPEHLELALASATGQDLALFAAGFALDVRLGQIAMRGSEPLLGQIGLAWWRDRFANLGQEAVSDPLLQELRDGWCEQREALMHLVDGWEALAVADDKGAASAKCFTSGRTELFRALAELTENGSAAEAAASAGADWAGADLARMGFRVVGPSPAMPRLPRRLRPLAVVAGLSRRAILRGDGILLGDRMSPLVALRLGIFGV